MPPRLRSRYSFTQPVRAYFGASLKSFLTEREPYGYYPFPDNRVHTVVEGETIELLAERYFPSYPDAARLYWVIADFQPEPILDTTIELEAGTLVYIPSERSLEEEILAEQRREEMYAGTS